MHQDGAPVVPNVGNDNLFLEKLVLSSTRFAPPQPGQLVSNPNGFIQSTNVSFCPTMEWWCRLLCMSLVDDTCVVKSWKHWNIFSLSQTIFSTTTVANASVARGARPLACPSTKGLLFNFAVTSSQKSVSSWFVVEGDTKIFEVAVLARLLGGFLKAKNASPASFVKCRELALSSGASGVPKCFLRLPSIIFCLIVASDVVPCALLLFAHNLRHAW